MPAPLAPRRAPCIDLGFPLLFPVFFLCVSFVLESPRVRTVGCSYCKGTKRQTKIGTHTGTRGTGDRRPCTGNLPTCFSFRVLFPTCVVTCDIQRCLQRPPRAPWPHQNCHHGFSGFSAPFWITASVFFFVFRSIPPWNRFRFRGENKGKHKRKAKETQRCLRLGLLLRRAVLELPGHVVVLPPGPLGRVLRGTCFAFNVSPNFHVLACQLALPTGDEPADSLRCVGVGVGAGNLRAHRWR